MRMSAVVLSLTFGKIIII